MGDMQQLAVIGLGSMGYGIAQSLLRAGHRVHGYDVQPRQAERFQSEGGAAGRLDDVATELDAIVVVVLNAAQTASVLFGETGVVPSLRAGAVVLACPTVPPEFAREMEKRCSEYNVHYLDAERLSIGPAAKPLLRLLTRTLVLIALARSAIGRPVAESLRLAIRVAPVRRLDSHARSPLGAPTLELALRARIALIVVVVAIATTDAGRVGVSFADASVVRVSFPDA